MHKTGSSSIQATLFRLQGDRIPWTYLHVGIANSSEALLNMFMQRPEGYQINMQRGLDKAAIYRRRTLFFERLEEQIAASDKDIMLSGKGITKLDHPELAQLAEWLGKHVDSILAVGYVRAPKSYIESSFQQNVKRGYSNFNLRPLYPFYQKRFEKFEDIFGRENVKYWLFDPANFEAGCVVRDFLNRLGYRLASEHVVRVNESLSLEALAMLYAFRKYGDGFGVGKQAMLENERLLRKLAEVKGAKFRLSPDRVRPILDLNTEDTQWMEERLGQRFSEDPELRTPFDVATEDELLDHSLSSLQQLREWACVPSAEQIRTPQDVARLVGLARRAFGSKLSEDRSNKASGPDEGAEEMTLRELVEKLKSSHPGEFDAIGDKKAVALLSAAFTEIRTEIESLDEGVLKLPPLGSLRVMPRVNKEGGRAAGGKRVMLRLPVQKDDVA
jgi:hypothetical protein